MNDYDYDAIVVGAGPAGAALTLRLARSGKTVLLVDGATFPRDKVCGEGIMPAGVEVLRELGLGGSLGELAMPFEGIRYRFPDGTSAQASFPGGLRGWGIARRSLDVQLVEAARREPNVDLRLGTWVQEVTLPAPGGVEAAVVVDGLTLRAPVLVAADGGRSRIRRQAGLELPAPRRPRFGVGGHFLHAPSREGETRVEVFVGGDHELYTTPVAPDVTCVAMLVGRTELARFQGRLEDGLRETLAQAGGRCEVLAQSPAVGRVKALGPLALQARRAHAERLLLAGDAAGALDPITGEGLSLALVTSRVAAAVLEGCYENGDFSARRLATWTRARELEVRPLARLTGLLLRFKDHPRHAARVVRALSRAPHTFERLLGVAAGVAPLSSLTLRDGVRVLLGV
jgi:2-polyprenyl-6-methoxyphenol hydroxylase-like FAD-dependent oxidoreductase